MSVYTSLRSSSSSLYGSIEDSESVSVSCKVVKRRQWFLWWSDLILFNCFCKKIRFSLFYISEKWLDNIYYTQYFWSVVFKYKNTFFLIAKDRFSITYILSILQAFGPLIIDRSMWDTTEIHNINHIKFRPPGESRALSISIVLLYKIIYYYYKLLMYSKIN